MVMNSVPSVCTAQFISGMLAGFVGDIPTIQERYRLFVNVPQWRHYTTVYGILTDKQVKENPNVYKTILSLGFVDAYTVKKPADGGEQSTGNLHFMIAEAQKFREALYNTESEEESMYKSSLTPPGKLEIQRRNGESVYCYLYPSSKDASMKYHYFRYNNSYMDEDNPQSNRARNYLGPAQATVEQLIKDDAMPYVTQDDTLSLIKSFIIYGSGVRYNLLFRPFFQDILNEMQGTKGKFYSTKCLRDNKVAVSSIREFLSKKKNNTFVELLLNDVYGWLRER